MAHETIQPIGHPRLKYNDFVDKGSTVLDALSASRFKPEFVAAMSDILHTLRPYERVEVLWWYAPYIYIEVHDTRYKHYPCGFRLLVSFDLTNGKLYSRESGNRYIVVRRGWVSCASRITGQKVNANGGGCNDLKKTTTC